MTTKKKKPSSTATQPSKKRGAPKGNQNAVGNPGGPGVEGVYQPEFAQEAEMLCAEGFTDLMLAEHFGVTEKTINRWKGKHIEFRTALKVGKEATDDFVERCTVKGISGYYVETQEMSGQGVVRTIRKWVPGNPGAGLKWLAVRRPEQYQQVKVTENKHTLSASMDRMLDIIEEKLKSERADRAKLIEHQPA
jgi:hypothetical protein